MPRAPRVLCIAGGPRRRGNSERLLDEAIAGARAAGAEVDKLVAIDEVHRGVRPCQGCNACSITGDCVLDDAMTAVYDRIDAADAIIVASPVFFATVPATLKVLLDRAQPYWARRYVLKLPLDRRRPGAILIAAAGGGNPFGTACADHPIRSVLGVLGVDVVDSLEVVGVDRPSDIDARPDDLARAREIGATVAEQAAASLS